MTLMNICRIWYHQQISINDFDGCMMTYIHQSHLLKFADDTKCFKSIATLSDCDYLQEDITNGCGPGGTSGSHTIVLGHGILSPAGC